MRRGHWDGGQSGRGPQKLQKRKPTQDSLPLQGLRLRFETLLIFPLFLYSTSVSGRNVGAVADRAAHAYSRTQSAQGHGGRSASRATRALGQLCQRRAAGCASEQWQGAGQAQDCWGPGVESRAKSGPAGGGPASWGPGAQCCAVRGGHAGAPGPPGALCLPLTLLPSQAEGCPRGGQMWPGPTPPAFWSQTPAERKRVTEEGKEASARAGALGVGLHACKLLGQPPAFPLRSPGLGPPMWLLGGPVLLPAWHSPELAPSLCVGLARPGLRLAGAF